jgi:hypothetical protein
MAARLTRRRFLRTAGAGTAALEWPGLSGLLSVSPVRADEAKVTPDAVRFGPDIEPVVRLIEETPRDRCVAALVDQLRGGLPYRRFLAAVFLAAVRKGDSHHSVYLACSAHQVSLDVRPEERLLPLFWAVDHFKWQQHDFPTPAMAPLRGDLPPAEKAAADFHEAMGRADAERAERAVVALARTDGARPAFDQLWQYGCRDSSFIGHRAISVTNSWRVLETIGWQHAEPVLRFVVRDLHLRGGGPDRFHRPNRERVDRIAGKLPAGWAAGRADRGRTLELVALLRAGQSEPACQWAAEQLGGGSGAQPVWDGVRVAAAELLMLHPAATGMAGRPLHVNTAVNALRFAYATCTVARTRLLILLQAVAWVADFIRTHLGEKALTDTKLVDLAGARPPASAREAIDEVFAGLPPRTYQFDSRTKTGAGHVLADRAARNDIGRKVFALVTRDPGAAAAYAQAARGWLSAKATVEAHEYKLPAALFEDCEWVSAEWRPRLLAAAAHWLHGKQSPDSEVLRQAREAVRRL